MTAASAIKLQSQQRLAFARIVNCDHKLRSKLKRNLHWKISIIKLLQYRPQIYYSREMFGPYTPSRNHKNVGVNLHFVSYTILESWKHSVDNNEMVYLTINGHLINSKKLRYRHLGPVL